MADTAIAPAAIAAASQLEDVALARAAIARIGFFCSERPAETVVTRLGGLTNLVFKVDCNGDSYVLRVPGKGTEDYIDRDFEAVAAREAARVGVSPEVIMADAKSGLMVSAFMPALTMSPRLFKSAAGAPARAAETLRRLHTSGAQFKFQFDPFSMLDEYLRVLSEQRRARVPEGFQRALSQTEALRKTLADHPARLVACHCDPLAENFLDTGGRMWLVDWEYSGMNDPMWDLGDFSVEAGLDPQQEAEMIAAYFGGQPKPSDRGRIVAYKAMCDLLWTLWGLVQLANKNSTDDFWQYANRRFDRCMGLMNSPPFAAHVAAIANG
jgi:thiamine kinase-like enzyme